MMVYKSLTPVLFKLYDYILANISVVILYKYTIHLMNAFESIKKVWINLTILF